mmetsp:Transcript_87826/g.170176  ORF Transcript_87826/g.170176 Transcript_87826/m.170176 type:complete len:748 (+) Transcript_87826:48-2291(+)
MDAAAAPTHVEGDFDPAAGCVCCNNPWARGTGDAFALMCGTCAPAEPQPDDGEKRAIEPANMDTSVNPSDNFFQYTNGGWMRSNPIPPEYPSWNTFTAMHVANQERLKALLAELQEKQEAAGGNGKAAALEGDEAKLACFYAAAMDEAAVEAAGTSPLQPLLSCCALAKEPGAARAQAVATLHSKFAVGAFFGVGSSPDAADANLTIAQVGQGGLGLPDRDYYFDEDKADKREAYKKHIAVMLTLLDGGGGGGGVPEEGGEEEPPAVFVAAAEIIFALELELAAAHMTKTEKRDPLKTYNKMSLEELSALNEEDTGNSEAAFDWFAFFAGLGKGASELGSVNVRNVEAVKKTVSVINSTSPETIELYLRWHAVNSKAPYLPKAFVDADFDFFQKTLSGTAEQKPRWKRAMAWTESALGEALGQLYCARHFDERAKAKALAIVETVRASLEERLKEVDWMTSAETRNQALAKMSSFRVKIGFPDKWVDYSSMGDLSRCTQSARGGQASFLGMVLQAQAFHEAREVSAMNAPTDRVKWEMTPQTVNAYYHPSLNEIVFPSAILQAPFFNVGADDAVNYGAMGAVVGHEMTHGFDDQGRKYDSEGTMRDWWTAGDASEYERRVNVMVEQASAYEVEGQNVQGKLTCGENIADLGGLRLALRALRSTPGYDEAKRVGGFTPTQRFFLSWAQAWRQNIGKERALQLLTLDPHGPNEMRCNGPLSNMPEFLEAFSVPEGAPMFKPETARVDIW